MDIQRRAIQIVRDRLRQYTEAQQLHQAEAYEIPQEELRAAFEKVVHADNPEKAYSEFIEQYGHEAWSRQVKLALRRLEKGQ